ncbi:hypothetical protein ASA1KI_28990 [Opitutales bacterium ASA1]|nr:hypothetical protein ASA1KI_28990 [Opitutales bacterium ASA1]
MASPESKPDRPARVWDAFNILSMKTPLTFALAALVLGSFSAAAQSTVASPASVSPAAAPNPKMLEVYGWFLGQQMELYSFGFSEAELAAVARGIAAAARGEESAEPIEEVGEALQAFLAARPQEVQEKRVAAGREEERAYFAELDASGTVKKTASGLRYEITAAGTGPKPTLGSTVVAHYTGRFVDGRVFDSSVNRGEPAEFPLDGVIEGWQEGMQMIGKGGRIKLHIPGDLAYGEPGRFGVPPAKTLVFDVELIDVRNELPRLAPAAP